MGDVRITCRNGSRGDVRLNPSMGEVSPLWIEGAANEVAAIAQTQAVLRPMSHVSRMAERSVLHRAAGLRRQGEPGRTWCSIGSSAARFAAHEGQTPTSVVYDPSRWVAAFDQILDNQFVRRALNPEDATTVTTDGRRAVDRSGVRLVVGRADRANDDQVLAAWLVATAWATVSTRSEAYANAAVAVTDRSALIDNLRGAATTLREAEDAAALADAHRRWKRGLGVGGSFAFAGRRSDRAWQPLILDENGIQSMNIGSATPAVATSVLTNATTRINCRQETDQLGATPRLPAGGPAGTAQLPHLGARAHHVAHSSPTPELALFDTSRHLKQTRGRLSMPSQIPTTSLCLEQVAPRWALQVGLNLQIGPRRRYAEQAARRPPRPGNTWRGRSVTELAPELRRLAEQLAGGPAFLLLGSKGSRLLGSTAIAYPWNGVYTTATSRDAAEMFTSGSRVTTSIGAMSRSPSRSQSDLEVRYLFGGTHLPESERPPKSAVEEATARLRSNQELTRLVTETVTPRGTILVEGWEPEDRLKADDLLPMLGLLGTAQAHLFNAGNWASAPLLEAFVSGGQVVLHSEPLESALAAIVDAGASKLPSGAGVAASQHVIPVGDGFVDIDIHTWNQIRRSARPIDLEILTPPLFSSDAARYQEFRNFIGATEGVPRWRGIAAGMNLTRDFAVQLVQLVRAELSDRELPTPIVVAGQTATGKSVALAALAMELARSGDFAVLHQSRRTVRPSVEDIDMYSSWAEERGAKAVILVWDGMLEPGEYEGLSRQLHARGRKVLVVGSAYKTKSDSSEIVLAPAELSEGETARLVDLLAGFGVDIVAPNQAVDASFLAFLYRWLPETEHQLRSGLSSEMRSAERSMARLARQRGSEATSEQRLTTLQAALQDAGLVLESLLPPNQSDGPIGDLTFVERAPIQRVTTLVLVAGRHGIPVPIDLAMRVLGREGYQSVRDALGSSDIVREIEDDNGDYFLSVRSQLEAELLAQNEIPIAVEVEVIVEAIQNVRVADGFMGGADEVEFLVKLLERVGPTSDKSRRYRRYFGDVADALRSRRTALGRTHPRFVLQESTFARDYVHWQQEVQDGSVEDRVASLEYNRDLLDEVLGGQATRGLIRLSLSVELASTLGAIIYEYAHSNRIENVQGLGSRLDDVLDAVLDARAVDPGNVYPVDVLAWSTRDAIESGVLSPAERVDHLANAVATLESLDRSSLTDKQRASLDRRGVELNQLLKNDDAVWDYLGKLELNESPAATYFLAQFDARDGSAGEARALQRLRQVPAETRSDWRCAQLLIDLTWKEITGSRLLLGERVPLHLSPQALNQIAQLATELGDADLPDGYRFLFVRAIAEFVAGHYVEAGRLFREVNGLSQQLSKRIYTAYLLADSSGHPTTFTGRVESSDARSGQVWVNELGARVKFEPRLFKQTGEFAQHQQLPPFYIGFKLSRGPVAEPRSVFRERQ